MRPWLSLLFLAGCGRDAPPPMIIPPDSGPPPYQEDTPCPRFPDGGAGGICNPLIQTGCNAGCNCGWIQDTATIGHIGCKPTGTSATGEVCNTVWTGGDSCGRGDVCIDGVCRAICDHQDPEPTCEAGLTCRTLEHVFTDGTNTVAGLCVP